MGYSPRGRKESDTTERLSDFTFTLGSSTSDFRKVQSTSDFRKVLYKKVGSNSSYIRDSLRIMG